MTNKKYGSTKHRIFSKGEQCHALLSSFNHPNILIPIKCLIKETKWDPINPLYKIKILKFYDQINFLKKYFFDMNFCNTYDGLARKISLKSEIIKNVNDLEKRLNQEDESRFYLIIDSIMATKTKADLQILFNNIQYFLIVRKIAELQELSTRGFYKGLFRLDSELEFKKRFHKYIGDKFDLYKEDYNQFIKTF